MMFHPADFRVAVLLAAVAVALVAGGLYLLAGT